MGYELNKLMRQFGVATPTMAPAPQMPGAAPVQSAYTGATGSPGDAAKYAADKAAFDENVRKYSLAQKAYDQYKTEYGNRLANTNMYNQAQFSTTGANVPAITTFSPAQRAAIGMTPAETPATAPGQQFAGLDQSGLNRLIRGYMAGNPSQQQIETDKKIYGVNDYDIRNAMGAGTQYGAPQWSNILQAPTYGVVPVSLAGKSMKDITDYYLSQRNIGYTDADLRAGADKTFGTMSNDDWAAILKSAYPQMDAQNINQMLQNYSPNVQSSNTNVNVSNMANNSYDTNSDYNLSDPNYDFNAGLYGAQGGSVEKLARKYAAGGQVKGYQAGGLTDPRTGAISYPAPQRPPLMRRPVGAPAPMETVGAPAPMETVGAPAPMETVGAPATTGRIGELEMMLQRYGPQDRGYAEEIATARQRSQTEADAFAEMLNRMISSPEDEQASKAEMYFRLAAAFGSPTQTGQFTENLALAGKEMADVARGKRESSAQKRALMLEAQKLKMGAAAEELETLRGLEAESMRDKRAIAQEIIKDYIASGKPTSNAGQIAKDMGLQPGTPEYIQKVEELSNLDIERRMQALDLQLQNMNLRQANLALAEQRALQLSPAEQQLRATTEDILDSTRTAMEQLADAYARNPNSLAGGWADKGQQFLLQAAGSDDPILLNTNVINNLLASQAVNKLKATFGGNISDGERGALEKLQGINAVSKEERAIIMRDAYKALQSIMRKNQTRLDQIVSGEYRMIQLPETLEEQ